MKRVTIFLATAMVMLSVSAQTPQTGKGKPKTKKEVEALLVNYSISLTNESQGQRPYYFFQARCKEAWAFRLEGDMLAQFSVVDESAGKVYLLDYKEKTGETYPYSPSLAYHGFNAMLAAYLFMHEHLIEDSNFKKQGQGKVAGRDATIYTYEYGNGLGTFWIDNQYGFTLKYVQTGSYVMQSEVTQFRTGNVTLADMVNLKDYKLKEANNEIEQ